MSSTIDATHFLPTHYHGLGAFRAWFDTGIPVLAYHAIARPPRGTRFRGLFYEPDKFIRQLSELRAADFQSAPLRDTIIEAGNPGRRIALTFDDGYGNLCEHALPALAANRFEAIVFLVAGKLGGTNDWDAGVGVASTPLMNQEQVRQWIAAGHRIGSHTLTHPHLAQIGASQAREEIQSSKKKLEDLFGAPVDDFCYPYGEYNASIAEQVSAAGYQTASTLRFGLNTATVSPFELNRLTVRRPTRSLKTLRKWIQRQVSAFR
jgi:peptidoglycan/xylan/chitin deacetylase (PgdA/CDA1 family)